MYARERFSYMGNRKQKKTYPSSLVSIFTAMGGGEEGEEKKAPADSF